MLHKTSKKYLSEKPENNFILRKMRGQHTSVLLTKHFLLNCYFLFSFETYCCSMKIDNLNTRLHIKLRLTLLLFAPKEMIQCQSCLSMLLFLLKILKNSRKTLKLYRDGKLFPLK